MTADPRLLLVERLHRASDWSAKVRAEASEHLATVESFLRLDEAGAGSRDLRELAVEVALDLAKLDGELQRLDDGAVGALRVVLDETTRDLMDTRTGDGAKP